MSIASRINEMAEHLRNDWDSIDKLGLDITEENSNDNLDKNIENIAPVLNRFYNQSSDKTDLAKNGVVGRTSQGGDPTPENPVEINNLSGDVEYRVRGQGISESFPLSLKSRNLFDYKTPNINQITWAPTDNGGLFTSSTFWRNLGNKLELDTTKQYTFSFGARNSTKLYYYIKTYTDETYNTVKTTIVNDGTALSKTFTPDSKYVSIYFANGGNLQNVEIPNIQLEESQTKTEFEPYYDIELCNISDYKDRIYSQNGEFYLEKKNGKVVFDGSENWTINTSYTYNVFYRTLGNYARISNTQTTYCEYYKGIENTAGIVDFGNNYNNSIGVRTANDNIKDIYISNNSITSASDFKTWLSTHNAVVYYVLATPTNTEITQENYPTLYSQLQAIQEFLIKYKINKEFLLDYSSPEIEY